MKLNELLEGLKDRAITNMEVEADKDGDISMLVINFDEGDRSVSSESGVVLLKGEGSTSKVDPEEKPEQASYDGFVELTRKLSSLVGALKDTIEEEEEDPTIYGYNLLRNNARRQLEELNKKGAQCAKLIDESDGELPISNLMDLFGNYGSEGE